MCAYSLDHITSRSLGYKLPKPSRVQANKLISHICERDIFKLDTNYQNKQKSLENYSV